MMKIYNKRKISSEELREIIKRPGDSTDNIMSIVRSICQDVKKRGDDAVREYGDLYEPTAVEVFRVSNDEIANAKEKVSAEFLEAVSVAEKNIRKFHLAQMRETETVEISEGITCRREFRPFDTVGLYIPAGSAPLPSTVLMLGTPAQIAGCGRIIICSPPNASGQVDRHVLAAAAYLGIKEVYIAGGAQAVAAMAYGTESIPKVDKIFGPGSRYVTLAKQVVSGDPAGCPVDLIAGPSEALIIADSSADENFAAWDLLAQAEHDPFSQVVLVTTDAAFAEKVYLRIQELVGRLKRRKIIEQSLARSFCVITPNLNDAVEFSNMYAPEHLIIMTENAEEIASKIKHAGSVFLGGYSPITAGDYASGTNHTLPTGGTAKWHGGLTVECFQKTITFQTLSREGLQSIAPTLITLTSAEGLEAHTNSVEVRLK